MVSATVSDEERQAIADFLARKQVTRCPDGEAQFAHIDWKAEPYESQIAARGLKGSSIVQAIRNGSRYDLVSQINAEGKAA